MTKSSAPPAHRTTRKARTNRGKFVSLERRYWHGLLSPEEEERFERLVLEVGRLYRVAL